MSSNEKFLPTLLEMWVPFSDTRRKKPDRTQLSHWTVCYSSISSPESWQHQCWMELCRLQRINTTLLSVLIRFFKPCLCSYFCPTGAWQKACCHLLQLEIKSKLLEERLCAEFLNDYWNFNQYLRFEKKGIFCKVNKCPGAKLKLKLITKTMSALSYPRQQRAHKWQHLFSTL